LMVASGVDFFTGMTAVGGGDFVDVSVGLLFGAGEEDLVASGELVAVGDGEADFSVVIDTLGSEAVASGVGAGVGLDSVSWASARGAVATASAVMARSAIFIWFIL
jgi:hypothetical protein